MHLLQKCSAWRELGKRHAENAGRMVPSSGPSTSVQVRRDNRHGFVSSEESSPLGRRAPSKKQVALSGVAPVLVALLPSEVLKVPRWHFCWPAQVQTAPPILSRCSTQGNKGERLSRSTEVPGGGAFGRGASKEFLGARGAWRVPLCHPK